MTTGVSRTAAWYRALDLTERVESLRRWRAAHGRDARTPWDAELARRELASWRAQAPLERDEWFARRLASQGLSEDELLVLLGEESGAVLARSASPPPWLVDLEEGLAYPPPAEPWGIPLSETLRAARSAAFLEAFEPLMRRGRDRLSDAAGELARRVPQAPFEAAGTVELLFANLPWQLLMMASRCFVLELNVARMEGRLAGETPQARFDDFVEHLREPAFVRALLEEYPLLARRVVEAIARWERFGLELLGHLCDDWTALREAFAGGRDPGGLTRVDMGAGDTHRGGRAVLVCGFAEGLRLVYKPRSLAVEARFGELVAWVNERGGPGLRAARVLERGEHGWVEFVEERPCASEQEVERFYRRQGGLLALFHALEATDLHLENLIASGEHPVAIDLETLFHGRAPVPPIVQPDARLVSEATARSVLRVGLLPQRSFAEEGFAGVDLSGMGGVEGQLTPDQVLQWADSGTDAMRARRERVTMPGSKNVPRLGESEASPARHADAVVEGFRETYRVLAEGRDALLAAGGPIERFAEVEVRSVLRATRSYFLLQQESFHPDFQRDCLELERFLDRLWVGVDENRYLARAVPAERRDLLRGDVPLFTTRPGSRDVWTSDGERIEAFWERSGLDLVRVRIAGLGPLDLQRQEWFVRASLATMTLRDDAKLLWPSYAPDPPPPAATREGLRERLVDAARGIGERLSRLALEDARDVTWVGLAFSRREWSLEPLSDDLYAGVSGLVLFLAQLGALSGDERPTELARKALRTFRRRLPATRAVARSVGAFNGWGGVLHVLAHLAVLWDEPELLEEAWRIVDVLPERIEEDEQYDVIGGVAGCVGGLLSLHAASPSERLLGLARRCGERIVEAARPMEVGLGWISPMQEDRPMTGFSHGGSGMAWTLARLARATGEARFAEAALGAILYEHTQFVPESGNWIDPSEPDEPAGPAGPAGESTKALSMAWCYGAPGIGLARLACLGTLDDAVVRRDLEAALDATVARGFGRNHCLCHGDLGNLDFLLQASEVLGDDGLRSIAYRRAASVLASVERDGPVTGVPLGADSPALMNGLAGIGLGLLRLAEPARVPSVLSLEPPAIG